MLYFVALRIKNYRKKAFRLAGNKNNNMKLKTNGELHLRVTDPTTAGTAADDQKREVSNIY